MKDFLWGSTVDRRKYHLIKWQTVCKSKEKGGLNVRDIETMGRALRAKWLWRYGTEQNSLWRRVIDSKYGDASHEWWPRAVRQSHGTGLWKGVMQDYELFKSNIKCRVGNGERTLFWKDVWTDAGPLQALFPRTYTISLAKNKTVSEVRSINEGNVVWDLQLRRRRFDWENEQYESLMTILNNESLEEGDDLWRWKPDKNGAFSVRSMYTILKEQSMEGATPFPANLVWKKNLPLKIQFFFWTVLHNRILTADNLIRRGSLISPVCNFCGCLNESISHLFLHCSVSLKIWKRITCPFPEIFYQLFAVDSVQLWLQEWRGGHKQEWAAKIWSLLPYATIWSIWKARNAKIFRGKVVKVDDVCKTIKATIWYWWGIWHGRRRYRFVDLVNSWEQVVLGQIQPG